MASRRPFIYCLFLAALVFGWLGWREFSALRQREDKVPVIVDKEAQVFTQRTFDPANPPAEMPPRTQGEEALCDSNFLSNVSVSGTTEQTDAADAIVTITGVKVSLGLVITISVPNDASQHVIEHEEGHREISEHYYVGAGQLASKIAANYIGTKELVSGADLNAEVNSLLQQEGNNIANEYNRELNPGAAQERYDLITDYSRNGVEAKDAVAEAIKDTATVAAAGN